MKTIYSYALVCVLSISFSNTVLAEQAAPSIDYEFAMTQCQFAGNEKLQAHQRTMGYAWCDIAIDVATLHKDTDRQAKFKALKQQAQSKLDAKSQEASRSLYKQLRVNVGLDAS